MVPSRRPCSMRLTSRRWLLGRPPPSYQCLLSTFATAPHRTGREPFSSSGSPMS
jgi:hypothetical protein